MSGGPRYRAPATEPLLSSPLRTALGGLFRACWLPVALPGELPEPDGAPPRVKVLGEDLPDLTANR